MNITEFLGQAVSILGMLFAMISFQCKKNRVFFTLQALSGASFAASFFILGNNVAACLNMFNILRGWAFGFAPQRSKKYFALLTAALYIGATVITYDPDSVALWLTLLILSAQLVGTTVMFIGDPKTIRIAQIAYMSPAWMVNNVIGFNLGGILCEAFNIISSIIAIIRFRKEWFSKKGKAADGDVS